MSTFKNKNILITGGASGIGKIMVRKSLELGAKVFIWDIDAEKMESTLKEFSNLGQLKAYRVDVSNYDQIKTAADQLKTELKTGVDILINNAGIIVGEYFHKNTPEDIAKTLKINTEAPMYITNEFLSSMMEKNSGHICNIASSAGIVSNPKMAVYAASKWAVVGWSDSLRLEMKQLGKDVNVTTIMPYYINTGMFDGVKSTLPILNPESAAQTIINAIRKNKKMVTLPGYIYRLTRVAQGLLPIAWYDWLMGNVLGVYKTMTDFKGRQK